MKYLVILFTLFCIFSISISESFGQYIGDKIPPGTILPDYEGDNIFPPDYVDFYYSDSQFEKYAVIAEQYRYDIPYMISDGSISKMNMDCSGVELVLDITSSGEQGWITLALPRHLIDSKTYSQQDDGFFTLSGSKDTQRSYTVASEKLGLLLIPFSNNTSQVSIVGMNDPEQTGANACNGKHEPPFSFLFSPLKQFNSGISFNEIQCKQNLVLIQKYDGSPACVKPSSIPDLIKRNWTTTEVLLDMPHTQLGKECGHYSHNEFLSRMQNHTLDDSCHDFIIEKALEDEKKMLEQGYLFDVNEQVWKKDGFPDTMMSISYHYMINLELENEN